MFFSIWGVFLKKKYCSEKVWQMKYLIFFLNTAYLIIWYPNDKQPPQIYAIHLKKFLM